MEPLSLWSFQAHITGSEPPPTAVPTPSPAGCRGSRSPEVERRRAERASRAAHWKHSPPALLQPGHAVAGEAERVDVATAVDRAALAGTVDGDRRARGRVPGGDAAAGDEGGAATSTTSSCTGPPAKTPSTCCGA